MPNNEPFSEDEQGRPLTVSDCSVTLQARKTNKYGKAHQRWHYDAETGFIHAFYADPYDKGEQFAVSMTKFTYYCRSNILVFS
jgi:hypothetical protein